MSSSCCGSIKKRVTFDLEDRSEVDGTWKSTKSVDSASGVRSISDIFPGVSSLQTAEHCAFHQSAELSASFSASAVVPLPRISLDSTAQAIHHRRVDSASVEASMSVSKASYDEDEVKFASGVFTIPPKLMYEWSSPPQKRGSFNKKSKKSIMKSISVDLDSVNTLNSRLEREAKAVDFVKKSDSVIMWKKSKKPVNSSIKVSADGSCLEISTRKFMRTKRTKIELVDLLGVRFGPRTKTFESFDWKNDHPWRCFSIMGHSGKTWDFQVDSDDKAVLWFFALQSLIPLSNSYVGWSRLLWMKVIYKTVSASEFSGIVLSNHWMHLVLDAKFSVRRAKRLSALVETPTFD